MRTAAATLALAAVLSAAACASSSPPASAPDSPAPAPSASQPAFGPDDFRRLALCAAVCETTGAIPFDHPRWGRTWLITFKSGDADPTAVHESGILAAVTGGEVRWSWRGGDWRVFQPATPPTDNTGHLFVLYNGGRYDGLLVLAPTASGFDDFASLPPESQQPISRFYSVALVDEDGDGTYEIRQDTNDCDPNCADGTVTTVLHHWNGSDYRQR